MSAEWSKIHNVWYRKSTLGPMQWVFPKSAQRVVASANGGPLAILYTGDTSTLEHHGSLPLFLDGALSSGSCLPKIENIQSLGIKLMVCTAFGNLLADIPWTHEVAFPVMSWAKGENLVCVFQSGVVRVFSALADLICTFHIESTKKYEDSENVISGKVRGATVVVLTSQMSFYIKKNVFDEQKCFRIPLQMNVIVCALEIILIQFGDVEHIEMQTFARSKHDSNDSKQKSFLESDKKFSSLPTHSKSNRQDNIGLLCALENGKLAFINEHQNAAHILDSNQQFKALIVSPSNRFVAAISTLDVLHVFKIRPILASKNLLDSAVPDASQSLEDKQPANKFKSEKIMMELIPIDTSPLPMTQSLSHSLSWVGDDCLAMHNIVEKDIAKTMYHGNSMMMIYLGGPNNTWIPFLLNQPDQFALLISEVDSLRVIGKTETYLIQKVAKSTLAACAAGSTAPAALLRFAYEQQDTLLAHDTLKELKFNLEEAILDCCDAALHEQDLSVITEMLEAAVFGRSILNNYEFFFEDVDAPAVDNSSSSSMSLNSLKKKQRRCCATYMRTLLDLRILNNLWSLANMPVTIEQCRRLQSTNLAGILSQRHLHSFALSLLERCGQNPVQKAQLRQHRASRAKKKGEAAGSYGSFVKLKDHDMKLSKVASKPLYKAEFLQRKYASEPFDNVIQTVKQFRQPQKPAQQIDDSRDSSGIPSYITWDAPKVLQHYLLRLIHQYRAQRQLQETDQIDSSQARSSLFQTIHDELKKYKHIRPRLDVVALYAYHNGLTDFVASILNSDIAEPVRVRALLTMGQFKAAVNWAIEQSNPDFLYECFAYQKHKIHDQQIHVDISECHSITASLQTAIASHTEFKKFYDHMCHRHKMLDSLCSFYEQHGALVSAGYSSLSKGLFCSASPSEKIDRLQLAHSAVLFASAVKQKGKSECEMLHKLTLEFVELLNFQKAYDAKYSSLPPTEGESLIRTIKILYTRNATAEIDNLTNLFKVTPSQMLKTRIQALASQ